jgi:drug/metabolite transporter (DMT)-like permease
VPPSIPRGLWAIHTAVLLFGLAGLLGKAVTVPPRMIVFSRALLAALALGSTLAVFRPTPKLSPRVLAFLLGSGALLGVHWLTFFHAIRISTVAIGLLAFASFPLFVTLLEPWLFGEPLQGADLFTAAAVMVGLALVVPSYDLSNRLTQGAAWGTVSGLTFAFLSLSTRKLVGTLSPLVVGAGQNAAAAALLLPFLQGGDWPSAPRDLLLLLALGLLCTALGHGLFIRGLATVRAQVARVIAGLEPVYGILFALVILKETPTLRTLLGGLVIVSATALASARRASAGPPPGPT